MVRRWTQMVKTAYEASTPTQRPAVHDRKAELDEVLQGPNMASSTHAKMGESAAAFLHLADVRALSSAFSQRLFGETSTFQEARSPEYTPDRLGAPGPDPSNAVAYDHSSDWLPHLASWLAPKFDRSYRARRIVEPISRRRPLRRDHPE